MSDAETLVVLLGGDEVGVVVRRRGRLTFRYRDEWRRSSMAMPLSLSMPLAASEHAHDEIAAFLWGLLPDNDRVLARWAERFQVSSSHVFGLLSHVGEDCAGAVQLVREDRLAALAKPKASGVEWLTEADVADRLLELRADTTAWRSARDRGQFSLAGAQPKTALLYDAGRWGVPYGRTPTTHILKPPAVGLPGHAENEHFCLGLAREVGLPAAASEVRRFGDETAIVVERFDRARTRVLADAAAAASPSDGRAEALRKLARSQPILRLHQEDMCQALGMMPSLKYQNEGGPAPKAIVELLRAHSARPAEDVATFIEALAFNWIIGGTDGHAKNYALLHRGEGRVRLAPLYDLASALPYPAFPVQKLKLAMKIGGTYRLDQIGPSHFRRLASEVDLDPGEVIDRIAELASRVVEATGVVRERALEDRLEAPVVGPLAEAITTRSRAAVRSFRR